MAGFELSSSLDEDSPCILNASLLLDKRYIPPEISGSSWDIVRSIPIHAIDAWGFGCLIYEIFNGPFSDQKDLLKKGSIPNGLYGFYKGFLEKDPKKRLDFNKFLVLARKEGAFFDNAFIKESLFLEELALKDIKEKKEFFGYVFYYFDNE